MNIEQIIANAPEGAERYYEHPSGHLLYYKKAKYHWIFGAYTQWFQSAMYWSEATPLPNPAYSAENPPPDGWRGETKVDSARWLKAFIDNGKLYFEDDGQSLKPYHELRETPTPRERFIEQAQQDGADFGAIYDEFLGGKQ